MKLLIQLLVIATLLIGITTFSIFIIRTDEGNTTGATLLIAIFGICILAIIYFFNLDKKIIQTEQNKTSLAVSKKTQEILISGNPYELRKTAIQHIKGLLAIFFVSSIFLIPGYVIRSNTVMSLVLIIIGLVLTCFLLVPFKRLIDSPIIKIDEIGIHHFWINNILWSDIKQIYLNVIEQKGVKNFQLNIEVTDINKYKSIIGKLSRLYGVVHHDSLILALPTNELNAKIIESLATAYSKKMNSPTIENQFKEANHYLEEIKRLSSLDKSAENTAALSFALKKSAKIAENISVEMQQKLKTAAIANRNIKILFAAFIIFLVIWVWYRLIH